MIFIITNYSLKSGHAEFSGGRFCVVLFMLKIGLTGGIGSGKTTVANLFAELGVPVFFADTETRMLQNTDAKLRAKIIAAFGDESYLPNGELNRQLLASKVFGNPEQLAQLNALVHPVVNRHFEKWCKAREKEGHRYVIKEAAILFESGTDKGLYGVIGVTAPEEVRIKRVMKRDGITEEQVRKRMESQWPEEKKMKLAGWIIHNNGIDLKKEVERLHNYLLILATEA
ncbi:MAG: dephospho-CoA kinase [Bacteroidia bacterium]|jgi:dephospho-CoA kinase|nr:dephospho-CoA kinase [Bacteroidia bacterium]